MACDEACDELVDPVRGLNASAATFIRGDGSAAALTRGEGSAAAMRGEGRGEGDVGREDDDSDVDVEVNPGAASPGGTAENGDAGGFVDADADPTALLLLLPNGLKE